MKKFKIALTKGKQTIFSHLISAKDEEAAYAECVKRGWALYRHFKIEVSEVIETIPV